MRARVIVTGLLAALFAAMASGAWVTGMFAEGSDPTTGLPDGASHDEARTAQVVRGDIEVVVAVEAVTIAAPSFVLRAPEKGTVQIPAGRSRNDDVPVAETIFRTADHDVTSPVPTRVEEWLVPDGGWVTSGLPVVRLTYPGFALVGTMPPADAYRLVNGDLTATGQIEGGPAGFECSVLHAPSATSEGQNAANAEARDATRGPGVVCAIPPDVRAYADLPGQIALRSGQVSDVLTLPVTAVSGSADAGEVWALDDQGEATVRKVRLGANDGARVQIVDGLAEGARVVATPPPLVR
jgi:hypothetical protein